MKLRHIGSNQAILETSKAEILFSYDTPVAIRIYGPDHKILRTDEYFSRTTSRHINSWLNGRKAEVCPQPYIESFLRERGD